MWSVALPLLVVAGCASADTTLPGVDGGSAQADAAIDTPCLDTDEDGVCNHLDQCPGSDDSVDTDMDTFADGCDQCPMGDDRIDLNANTIPDCTELQTMTVSVKLVGSNYWRGWYSATGAHESDNDYSNTGLYLGTNYNAYFVFSLAGFAPTSVAGVTFELEKEEYEADAMETLSFWDVTTAPATVESGGGVAVHDDLGSGNTYGTFEVTSAMPNGTVMTIPLNAQAATDLAAKAGQDFAIGIHVDTPPGWMRFGREEARVARLVIRYL